MDAYIFPVELWREELAILRELEGFQSCSFLKTRLSSADIFRLKNRIANAVRAAYEELERAVRTPLSSQKFSDQ